MNRTLLINHLVSAHHTRCCDCAAFRTQCEADSDGLLLWEYILVYGDGSDAERRRLQGGDSDALAKEIAQKKGHSI